MSRRAEVTLVALVGALTLVAYHALFARFLPGPDGKLGHDYSYFFPQLLNGAYWFANNGWFELPWFTPAFGAGMPYYPNPVNAYYSVPQLLCFAVDPLTAVRVTLVLFAALGFLGTYLLLRRGFETSLSAALFGACAFAFNGFFSHRMLVGHLAFHSFMLIPLIGYWTLRGAGTGAGARWRLLRDVLLLALAYAYLLQSANVHGIPVVLLAVAAFATLLGLRRGWRWGWLVRTALAGPLALALCATKLSASAAFMGSFPRTGYPLPGFADLGGALVMIVRSVFGASPPAGAPAAIVNVLWKLDRHEFEYGLTLVPAVVLLAGGLVAAVRLRDPAQRAVLRRRGWMVVVLALILSLPVALNVHGEAWTAFVKSIPLFGSSSSMIRFLSTFVPIAVVGAALAFDAMHLTQRIAGVTAAACVLAMVGLHWQADREFYAHNGYPSGPIVEAWHELQATATPPPVERIVAPFNAAGEPFLSIDRNDALIRGESQLICYEPIFGYQQEWFPMGPARFMAPALEPLDARLLNVKNPACFVFPEQNGGEPGAHFRRDQREAAEAFLAYRPFEFEQSRTQALANAINLAALVLVPLLLLASAFGGRPRRRTPQ